MISLITGVGRAGQLGEAVAYALGQRGDVVLLVGHHEADASARAAQLMEKGIRAEAWIGLLRAGAEAVPRTGGTVQGNRTAAPAQAGPGKMGKPCGKPLLTTPRPKKVCWCKRANPPSPAGKAAGIVLVRNCWLRSRWRSERSPFGRDPQRRLPKTQETSDAELRNLAEPPVQRIVLVIK